MDLMKTGMHVALINNRQKILKEVDRFLLLPKLSDFY